MFFFGTTSVKSRVHLTLLHPFRPSSVHVLGSHAGQPPAEVCSQVARPGPLDVSRTRTELPSGPHRQTQLPPTGLCL